MRVLQVEKISGPRHAYDLNVADSHCYFVGSGSLAHNCSFQYSEGVLVQALTRGDGEIGEDITRNVLRMKGFPKTGMETFTGFVRGEIVCLRSDFEEHFPDGSNPRNTASGTAKRQSDTEECKYLTVFAYQLVPDTGALPSKAQELAALKAHGFTVPNHFSAATAADVEKLYAVYNEGQRKGLDYDIDGLVAEADAASIRENLGDLNHRPKAAIALKFPHEAKPTVLRNVVWQVGKSGRVTPVAVFDPIALAGAQVSRASMATVARYLELAAEIGSQELRVGDQLIAVRRNEVIPRIEHAISRGDPSAAILPVPSSCPECNAILHMDGEYLVCPNDVLCPAQKSGAVKRWLDKLGILGWGGAIVDGLCDKGLVNTPADLYTLTYEKLSALELSGRVVGSTATVLLENLRAKTELDLHLFVGSLGIPLCARSICKTIADAGFDTLIKMQEAKSWDLAQIPGMGTTKAYAFVSGIAQRKELIEKLLKVIRIKGPSMGNFKGMSVCLTGFRDKSMEEAIESQGGTMKSGVSKGLTILVTKDPSSTSGKAEKARSIGVKIVGVDEMWQLLGKTGG